MSSTPNRASNPAGKPRRKEITLDLSTARQMLPLVKSIVSDIVTSRTALNRLTPEQDRLERHRRDLVWKERQRRYQVQEEIRTAEKSLTTALTELTALGLSLLDDESGEVDFPTKINGRTAAFNWKFGEDGVRHWHYTGEEQRRTITADWDQPTAPHREPSMSNSPNRASNPAGKPRRKETTLDLATARQMLPLVKSIVSDIVTSRTMLSRLTPEQERLDRHRRDLVWQERARRYQVQEEITAVEKSLTRALSELTDLGLSLLDDEAGEVDFPTKVNGRTAAFNWKLGEEAVRHWHYTGEEQRRPIPTDWDQPSATPIRFRGNP